MIEIAPVHSSRDALPLNGCNGCSPSPVSMLYEYFNFALSPSSRSEEKSARFMITSPTPTRDVWLIVARRIADENVGSLSFASTTTTSTVAMASRCAFEAVDATTSKRWIAVASRSSAPFSNTHPVGSTVKGRFATKLPSIPPILNVVNELKRLLPTSSPAESLNKTSSALPISSGICTV